MKINLFFKNIIKNYNIFKYENFYYTNKKEIIWNELIDCKNLNDNLKIIKNNNNDSNLILYSIFQIYLNHNENYKINNNIDYLINTLSYKILDEFSSINLIKLSLITNFIGKMEIKNELFWLNLEKILNSDNKLKLFNYSNLINIIEGFYSIERLMNLKYLNYIKNEINLNITKLNHEQKEIYENIISNF